MLRILAVEDDICKDIHCLIKMFLGNGGIKHGVFFVGKSIEFSTHTFEGIDNLNGIAPLCAFKGHVFAEVG